jgi:hypothetical protein
MNPGFPHSNNYYLKLRQSSGLAAFVYMHWIYLSN